MTSFNFKNHYRQVVYEITKLYETNKNKQKYLDDRFVKGFTINLIPSVFQRKVFTEIKEKLTKESFSKESLHTK